MAQRQGRTSQASFLHDAKSRSLGWSLPSSQKYTAALSTVSTELEIRQALSHRTENHLSRVYEVGGCAPIGSEKTVSIQTVSSTRGGCFCSHTFGSWSADERGVPCCQPYSGSSSDPTLTETLPNICPQSLECTVPGSAQDILLVFLKSNVCKSASFTNSPVGFFRTPGGSL